MYFIWIKDVVHEHKKKLRNGHDKTPLPSLLVAYTQLVKGGGE
jgi:hypothetical protein